MSNRSSAFLSIAEAINNVIGFNSEDLNVLVNKAKEINKEHTKKIKPGKNLNFLENKLGEDVPPSKEKKSKVSLDEDIKKPKKSIDNLEDDLEETDTDLDNQDIVSVDYSFQEEELILTGIYGSKAIDYVKMFYGDEGKVPPSFGQIDPYMSEGIVASDKAEESLSVAEAKETLIAIQYATVLGTSQEINSEQRRKFDTWIKFNPSLFNMFQTIHGITSDVDYKPL